MSYFAASGSDQEPDFEEYQDGRGLDEGKAHLLRLFVAWVPKLFTEHDLKPLFDQVRVAHSGGVARFFVVSFLDQHESNSCITESL